MHHAFFVQRIEPGRDPARNGQRLIGRHRPPRQPLRQRFAGAVLHGEERRFAIDEQVVDPAYIGVRNRAGDSNLRAEAVKSDLIVPQIEPEGLDSDLAEFPVFRQKNRTHSALAERTEDPEAAQQSVARFDLR